MNRIIAAVVATAIVVAVVMLLVVRYGGRSLLRSDSDASSSMAQSQNQPQPPQFPPMELQGQFAGPLQGTVIQRWRDPVDGTICYIYSPMVVHHNPAPAGNVEYGSNTVGSISCIHDPSVKERPAK